MSVWDDFKRHERAQREQMLRAEAAQRQQRANPGGKYTEEQLRERALVSVMADWPLKPGQMLFMGPKSVAALTGNAAAHHPRDLTDTIVIEKSEWLGETISKPGRKTRNRAPQ